MTEKNFSRYSLISTKLPREMLLLVGTGCKWKKCTFCDYHNDLFDDPFSINKKIINKLTGKFGVLDIVNSGSCFELDNKTLDLLKEKAENLKIHTIWFESHWLYHNKLNDFKKKFSGINLKFRVGIETFNPSLRKAWCKGIPSNITAKRISKYFNGICLLIGIKGQTKDIILKDINLALEYFEYFSINIFNNNTTQTERDENLISWFENNMFPNLKNHPCVEILIDNKDLGIG